MKTKRLFKIGLPIIMLTGILVGCSCSDGDEIETGTKESKYFKQECVQGVSVPIPKRIYSDVIDIQVLSAAAYDAYRNGIEEMSYDYNYEIANYHHYSYSDLETFLIDVQSDCNYGYDLKNINNDINAYNLVNSFICPQIEDISNITNVEIKNIDDELIGIVADIDFTYTSFRYFERIYFWNSDEEIDINEELHGKIGLYQYDNKQYYVIVGCKDGEITNEEMDKIINGISFSNKESSLVTTMLNAKENKVSGPVADGEYWVTYNVKGFWWAEANRANSNYFYNSLSLCDSFYSSKLDYGYDWYGSVTINAYENFDLNSYISEQVTENYFDQMECSMISDRYETEIGTYNKYIYEFDYGIGVINCVLYTREIDGVTLTVFVTYMDYYGKYDEFVEKLVENDILNDIELTKTTGNEEIISSKGTNGFYEYWDIHTDTLKSFQYAEYEDLLIPLD